MSDVRLIQVNSPLEIRVNKRDDVVRYDSDNLYPQRIANLILSSKTASKAAEKMAENIECDGFANADIAALANAHGDTLDVILRKISADLSKFNGYGLVVQYNALREVIAVYHIPFEYIRISSNEDYANDTRIRSFKVFNNWERGGDIEKDANTGVVYNAFNPDNVADEIEAAGGIEQYKGQLLYVKNVAYRGYPYSPFHAVQAEMYTEMGTAKVAQQLLSKGFHDNKIVEHSKFSGDEAHMNEEFGDAIETMAGSDSAASFITFANPFMDSPMIRIHEFGTPIDANLYNALSEPLKKDICMSANALPLGLIDTAALGVTNVSGNTVLEMRRLYRASLQRYRNMIAGSLARVFDMPIAAFEIAYNLT